MKYGRIKEAIFLERPNRFLAQCSMEGEIVIAHVKNTGRCKELFIPGSIVYLEESTNKERKTKWSLISLRKEENGRLINLDSQAPNQVVYEALSQGMLHLPGIEEEVTLLKREKVYGSSRFDLYFETKTKKGFIEVKGVTLEEEGVALFPDAPTQRGVKHIMELEQVKADGMESYLLFVIQMEGVLYFTPNWRTHKAFGEALDMAKEKGVCIFAYDCKVQPGELWINREVEVR